MSLESLTNLVECMWVRKGALLKEEHQKGASLLHGLAFLENIRLGWEGLSETKSLAYYEHSLVTPMFYDIGLC